MATENKKKSVLVPGWMNLSGMYGDKYEVLEIWQNKLNPDIKVDCAYLIGHSLGARWAILNWNIYKDKKLILVNPPLPQRKYTDWFVRWIKFQRNEEEPESKQIAEGLTSKLFGFEKFFDLFGKNPDEILKCIPKEDIHVVIGKNDSYFCDYEAENYLKEMGITVISVDAGHDWNEEIDKAIERIIKP